MQANRFLQVVHHFVDVALFARDERRLDVCLPELAVPLNCLLVVAQRVGQLLGAIERKCQIEVSLRPFAASRNASGDANNCLRKHAIAPATAFFLAGHLVLLQLVLDDLAEQLGSLRFTRGSSLLPSV